MDMKAQPLQPTISTFSVTKGGKIAETYACFAQWDLTASLDANLELLRSANPIMARTDAWLKEMRRIFRARFGDIERHRPLIRLAQGGYQQECWAPMLLWHLCLRELLLSDFLESWLFPRKQEGMLLVRGADVRETYIHSLTERGLIATPWKESVISKMSSSLPAYAADFGLLQGKVNKEIAPYHPPDEALIYVLHVMASETSNAEKILEDRRWRRYLLSRRELESELLRLHQLGKLRFETMGSVIVLELSHTSVDEYVEHLVG